MGQPHTGPRCSIHRNEANTTTYNSNFPTQQSQKVTLQQHDLSILQVGSHQLQHQLSRINKPKSHHKTNTFCPVTQKPHQHQCAGCRRARLRCPWAAAGPGRTTSRRAEQSSRRGRRAGGPPPTGTPSSPAAIAAPTRGTRSHVRPQLGTPQPYNPHARPRTQTRPRT